MVRLYQSCALMVYPSLYEGLGLPIIEAMACGAARLGQRRRPDARDRHDSREARFDPTTSAAIRERLAYALANPAFLESLRGAALRDAGRYTWE